MPIQLLRYRLRPGRLFRLLGAGLGAMLAVACSADSDRAEGATSRVEGSLLAVGDTGVQWGPLPWLFEGQLAVGTAMQREHSADPVEAVVLLGDNFYPDGLLRDDLLPRLVENVARPYCAFVAPSKIFERSFTDACGEGLSAPPPLWAVLGNHDFRAPESAELQREEVPRFIENWQVPSGEGVTTRDLPGGLSLLFVSSESPWDEAKTESLASALAESKGPWRVVIGHRPPISGHPGLSRMIEGASKKSGRMIHAYLAGHVHALGAVRGQGFAPGLTAIAGSGASAEHQESTEYEIADPDVLVESLGFLRVDSMSGGSGPYLRVRFFKVRSSPALAFLGHTLVAEFRIGLDGGVLRLGSAS